MDQISHLWLGSYTSDGGGHGTGLGFLRRSERGSLTIVSSAEAASPSFVALHPHLNVLYAAEEFRGVVSVWSISRWTGLAHRIDQQPSGTTVCHVGVSADGGTVTSAAWGDGSVVVYAVKTDGRLTRGAWMEPAADRRGPVPTVDPHTGRPRQSRAHATVELAHRRFATTDLGLDLVRVWERRPSGTMEVQRVELAPGSGPRHLVRGASGHLYVITEYSLEVVVLEPDAGGRFGVSSVVPVLPGEGSSTDAAAEICWDHEQRRLYVAVRGSDRLAVLDAKGPSVTLRGSVSSGGANPRHHVVVGDTIHVAHQGSGEITTHRLDTDSGLPCGIVHRLETGSPSVLVPVPSRDGGLSPDFLAADPAADVGA